RWARVRTWYCARRRVSGWSWAFDLLQAGGHSRAATAEWGPNRSTLRRPRNFGKTAGPTPGVLRERRVKTPRSDALRTALGRRQPSHTGRVRLSSQVE